MAKGKLRRKTQREEIMKAFEHRQKEKAERRKRHVVNNSAVFSGDNPECI